MDAETTPQTEPNTPDTTEQTPPAAAPAKEPKTVPYDRFNEVLKRLQEAEAKLPDGDKLRKELETERAARQTAELNALRVTVAQRAGLPTELAPRLQGATEAELVADAAQLAKLTKTRAPGTDGDKKGEAEKRTFTQKELTDPVFFTKNRDAILLAVREGRIK